MKPSEMTMDQLKACALKCPIKLPVSNGKVPIDSGNFYVYPAKTEVSKKYRKKAIQDLRDRELRGGSYPGDIGKVVIGGSNESGGFCN